jgi:dGTPase
MVKRAKEKAGYGKNYIDSSQYSKMFRQELASSLINLVINDIDFIKYKLEYF